MVVKSARLLCRLVVAGLGFGSAARLDSLQGCNHLWQHLLITEGCLDYHTMFNGNLPYDEYYNPQHKQRYVSRVPPQRAVLLISPHRNPPQSQSEDTVQIALGKLKSRSINNLDAKPALLLRLFPYIAQ